MALKNLLVHLDSTARAQERLGLAAALAKRFGARLTGLFAEGATLGGSLVGRRSPQQMGRAVEEARARFDEATRETGVGAGWLEVPPADAAEVIGWMTVCCRYFDLCLFGQHDPDHDAPLPADAVEQVLVDSGRPALVVPYVGRYPDAGRRVLVAWTGSREAARAVNDALPFLATAERVELLSGQRPPRAEPGPAAPSLDVVQHLRAHGVEAHRETAFVEDLSFGDIVLNRAAEIGADLIVMGAHGALGFPFLQRSSTTRDTLRTMTAPLLLSR